jgi:hypothetical protein
MLLVVVLLLAAVGGEIMVIDTVGMADGELLLARGFDIFVADVEETKKVFAERRRRGQSRRNGSRAGQRKTLDHRQHMNQHETDQQSTSRHSLNRTNKGFHFFFFF